MYNLGLASFVETLRFRWIRFKNKEKNQQFRKNHTGILPPDFYLYETFGLNYERFVLGGKETAEWIIKSFEQYTELNHKSILDWGCGPGRTLIHLPQINPEMKVFGSDYNKDYAHWCSENIQNVTVKKNELAPPLPFESEQFHAIFGISIFTHLSLEMHKAWLQELHRVLKKGGLLMLTTHGEASKMLLNSNQLKQFDNNELVVQGYKVEGNRLYAAYQPKAFFQSLAESFGFKVLEHTEGKVINGKMNQDVWMLQKP